MPILSVLHNDLLIPENIDPYIRRHPTWDLIRTSTVGGQTKPYFWATSGRGPRVMPETWTETEIKLVQSLHLDLSLTSAELKDQEYEDLISILKSRSRDLASAVDQVD